MKYHIIKRRDLNAIRRVIAAGLKVEVSKVTLKADLVKDLGMDSLDIYEMIYLMEERFGDGLSIPDDDVWEHIDSHGSSVRSAFNFVIPYIRGHRIKKAREYNITPYFLDVYKEERGIA